MSVCMSVTLKLPSPSLPPAAAPLSSSELSSVKNLRSQIERQRDKETKRQRDKEIERQRVRESEIDRERQRKTERDRETDRQRVSCLPLYVGFFTDNKAITPKQKHSQQSFNVYL